MICPRCKGHGSEPDDDDRSCCECGGSGEVPDLPVNPDFDKPAIREPE